MSLTNNGLAVLDEGECIHLLHTASIGRVAVSVGGAAAILPVNYAMVGSDVMFFTGEGLKLNAALTRTVVTFEADDINVDECSGWSVIAVGPASRASARDEAAVASLGLYPWAAGDRHHLIRIRPTFLSGRRIL